jgi:hypothetical protein
MRRLILLGIMLVGVLAGTAGCATNTQPLRKTGQACDGRPAPKAEPPRRP